MSFANLRELLIKRTDDAAARLLISGISDSVLGGMVIEALEKMANNNSANHAIAIAAGHNVPVPLKERHAETGDLVPTGTHPLASMDAALVHDALSHHATHYKAALNAGNREVADKHLEQLCRTVNYAKKMHAAIKHGSGGVKLSSASTAPMVKDEKGDLFSAPDSAQLINTAPWQMNYIGPLKHSKTNHAIEELDGWDRQPRTRGVPDLRYLEMAPHSEHPNLDSKTKIGDHAESAYPWHDLQVNGRHIVIDDIQHPGEFTPHALDSHPALSHAYKFSSASKVGLQADGARQFADQHKAWLKSPEMESWLKNQETKHADDPFSYEARGSFPSDPVLEKPTPNDLHPVFGKWDMTDPRDQKRVLGEDDSHALRYVQRGGKYSDHVKKHLGMGADDELAKLNFTPEHIEGLKNAVKGGLPNDAIISMFPDLTDDILNRMRGK